jgi:hypothetical protein
MKIAKVQKWKHQTLKSPITNWFLCFFGIWHLSFGILFGIWCLLFGILFGIWCLLFGISNLTYVHNNFYPENQQRFYPNFQS